MLFQSIPLRDTELETIEKIDIIRAKLSYALQTPKRWTGFLRRNLTAKAIRGSNSIEGYNVTFEDAVAALEGEEPMDAAPEPWAATLGYRNALTYVMQLSDDPFFNFNEELVRGLHNLMLMHDPTKNPGRWRPGLIFVRREPSGEIVYEGPEADQVPKLMREFVESVQNHDASIHVIVRAAMAHLNLVMIHPFSDGNGRMGRALQTLVLARDGILVPPFCSIEEWLGFKGNTDAYYEVLMQVGAGSWHPERDTRLWIRFCLGAHLHQALTVSRRVKQTEKLWSELEVELERRKLDERMIYALYDAAIGIRLRSARYRLVAEISNQVAARDLRILVREGLLEPKGEKRGRTYVRSTILQALYEKTLEPKVPFQNPFEIDTAPTMKDMPIAPPSVHGPPAGVLRKELGPSDSLDQPDRPESR